MDFGYPAFNGTLISAPRRNTIPGQNGGSSSVVVNLTIAVNTQPIGRMLKLANGEEQFALVPTSDVHDVSVWDAELQATALGLSVGQAISFTARSIKGGKPYEAEDADGNKRTIFTTKIRAAGIVPGALSSAKGQSAPAAAAPVAAAAGAAEDDLNF
jgi:hypothetical protein